MEMIKSSNPAAMLDTFKLYVMKTRSKLDYLLTFYPMFSGGQVTIPKLTRTKMP